MRKKHAASEVAHMSLCGHEGTPQEYKNMKERMLRYVNCKRCQDALKLRELIKNDEI